MGDDDGRELGRIQPQSFDVFNNLRSAWPGAGIDQNKTAQVRDRPYSPWDQ